MGDLRVRTTCATGQEARRLLGHNSGHTGTSVREVSGMHPGGVAKAQDDQRTLRAAHGQTGAQGASHRHASDDDVAGTRKGRLLRRMVERQRAGSHQQHEGGATWLNTRQNHGTSVDIQHRLRGVVWGGWFWIVFVLDKSAWWTLLAIVISGAQLKGSSFGIAATVQKAER